MDPEKLGRILEMLQTLQSEIEALSPEAKTSAMDEQMTLEDATEEETEDEEMAGTAEDPKKLKKDLLLRSMKGI